MRFAEIVVLAAQTYAERTGNGRFGMSAVRTRMFCRIAAQYAPSPASIEMQQECGKNEECARHARRDIIEHSVETRRHPAEIQIFRILVAEHGIHRVRCAIQHGERQAADQIEKEWRDDAVDRIFRHGFNRRARRLRGTELFRITADDPADLPARFGKLSILEQIPYLHARHSQTFG